MSLSRSEYVYRVLIALGLLALGVVLFEALQIAARAVLILFAGVLMAVLLDGLARLISWHTPLSRLIALALVLLLVVASAVGTAWVLGPQVGDQMMQLAERLPETVNQVEAWLRQQGWGAFIAERIPESADGALPEGESGLGMLRTAFSTAVGALTNAFIVLFMAIFLAVNPALYVDALIRLVPISRRSRAQDVFAALGTAMRYWLLGRIASMLVVGALTAVELGLFGIPLALALGLITALLAFIPYIGAILAAVIAVGVAAAEGTQAVVTVLVVYTLVQLVESYLITPLIQQRVVSMPPALLIAAQVVLGVLVGAVGVAVATPLAVVVIVLVQMLYIEDVLGDEVEVMGGGEPEHAS
jgi:predicted PurR-regulated permease PerM